MTQRRSISMIISWLPLAGIVLSLSTNRFLIDNIHFMHRFSIEMFERRKFSINNMIIKWIYTINIWWSAGDTTTSIQLHIQCEIDKLSSSRDRSFHSNGCAPNANYFSWCRRRVVAFLCDWSITLSRAFDANLNASSIHVFKCGSLEVSITLLGAWLILHVIYGGSIEWLPFYAASRNKQSLSHTYI